MSTADLDLTSMDALLGAMMDDLDDLPPMGVPPSGHYNLTVTFDIKKIGDDNKEVIAAEYTVDEINELKDEAERGDVAVGMKFTEFFHVKKKDGSTNTFGIGKLKQRLAPFASLAEDRSVGGVINAVKQIAVAATIKRTVNKKNEDQFNVDLKDIVVL
jgi:hypothetical protein